jgi:hypothetical protein
MPRSAPASHRSAHPPSRTAWISFDPTNRTTSQGTTKRSPTATADFLARLDGQLAGVAGADFVHRFVRDQMKTEPAPEQQAILQDRDAMFRRMLRTLLITQGFRDEEPETQFRNGATT